MTVTKYLSWGITVILWSYIISSYSIHMANTVYNVSCNTIYELIIFIIQDVYNWTYVEVVKWNLSFLIDWIDPDELLVKFLNLSLS